MLMGGRIEGWRDQICPPEEAQLTIAILAPRVLSAQRELAAHRVALNATGSDKRRHVWAFELHRRRNAVARWRGQPSCSLHEVMRVLDQSLA
jgi:hypothetical protein